MHPIKGEFNFTRLESVLYGPGKVALLSRELAKRNAKRAVIVTSKTLGRSKLLDKVKEAAGSALAGVFAETSQHVPSKTVEVAGCRGAPSQGGFVHHLRRRHSQRYREGRGECAARRQASDGLDLYAAPAPDESCGGCFPRSRFRPRSQPASSPHSPA